MAPSSKTYWGIYTDALAFYYNTLGMSEHDARRCAKRECLLEFCGRAHFYH